MHKAGGCTAPPLWHRNALADLVLCKASLSSLLQQSTHLACQQVKTCLAHTGNTWPQHPAQVRHDCIVLAHAILVGKSLQQPGPFTSNLQPLFAAPLQVEVHSNAPSEEDRNGRAISTNPAQLSQQLTTAVSCSWYCCLLLKPLGRRHTVLHSTAFNEAQCSSSDITAS